MEELNERLSRMTLRQKLAQLTQIDSSLLCPNGTVTGPMNRMNLTGEDVAATGTVLNICGAKTVRELQRRHLAEDPNQLPLLFMMDVIHGYRTIFPIPLALGCSWDPRTAETTARLSAKEAAAAGIQVTFAPMTDLVRDARWGRVMESTGEDPFLNGLFARAFVRGFQGKDLSRPDALAACVKHFAGYGAVEGGRDYNAAELSEHTLREEYLPAYKAALDEGCAMVMTSFNTLGGVPAAANARLLRGVLRGEWKFDGVVISDWGAVSEIITHGAAADGREAARRALQAGVDIEMMSTHFLSEGEALVRSGEVDGRLIDEAVLRVLKLKERLGLFENPLHGLSEENETKLFCCPEHRAAARDVARRSMVLLKNNGALPLSREQRVAVVGPFAESRRLIGDWKCMGRDEDAVSLREGILSKTPPERAAFASTGVGFPAADEGEPDARQAALRAAAGADVVVLALGEDYNMSGEARSRAFLRLPEAQRELAEQVFALGKPTVAVLFNGRPLELGGLQKADAILEAWYPGTEGGNAVADLLYGDFNPQGRLTMSFPRVSSGLPLYYNHLNTGRPCPPHPGPTDYCSRYIDLPNGPLYPFGYGLSYTTFEYGGLTLDRSELRKGETLTATVRVRNTGRRAGVETVQLYLRDVAASVARPVRELKAFEQVALEPGRERLVSFRVTEKTLRFHTLENGFSAEPGGFELYVGPNAAEGLKAAFVYRA